MITSRPIQGPIPYHYSQIQHLATTQKITINNLTYDETSLLVAEILCTSASKIHDRLLREIFIKGENNFFRSVTL